MPSINLHLLDLPDIPPAQPTAAAPPILTAAPTTAAPTAAAPTAASPTAASPAKAPPTAAASNPPFQVPLAVSATPSLPPTADLALPPVATLTVPTPTTESALSPAGQPPAPVKTSRKMEAVDRHDYLRFKGTVSQKLRPMLLFDRSCFKHCPPIFKKYFD